MKEEKYRPKLIEEKKITALNTRPVNPPSTTKHTQAMEMKAKRKEEIKKIKEEKEKEDAFRIQKQKEVN